MKRVFKYPVSLVDATTLELTGPIVHVGLQPDGYEVNSQLYVWAEQGVWERPRKMRVFVYGTGHAMDRSEKHIGSVVDPKSGLVWHLYEAVK